MPEKRSIKHRRLQMLRIFSQIFFFGLFISLLLATHYSGEDYIGSVESFFHFDPLIALITFIASRTFLIASLWALFTVVLTVVFGRFVCGWVCPMGSLLQFFSFLFKKTKSLFRRHKMYCFYIIQGLNLFRGTVIFLPKLPRFASLTHMTAVYVSSFGTSPKYPPPPPQEGHILLSD